MALRRRNGLSMPRMAAVIALVAVLIGCDETSQGPATGAEAPAVAPAEVGAPAELAVLLGPWQANPVSIGPAMRDVVAQVCAGSMQPFPAVPLVAVDARGEGVIQALFAGAGGQAACYDMTLGADGNVQAMGGGMTGMGPPGPPLAANALQSAGLSSSGGEGNRVASSVITGRAGAGIAIVAIDMPGRPRMTATLANGWYLFWWPGALPGGTKVIGLDGFGGTVAQTDP